MNHFLDHSEKEADYFLLLVQYARAGTVSLEKYFLDKIEQSSQLENRFNANSDTLSDSHSYYYYQTWYISAIHVLLSVKKIITAEHISNYLGLSRKKVRETLDSLIELGLVEEKKGKLQLGQKRVYAPAGSIRSERNHTNWRQHAIGAIAKRKKENIHYSAVYTMSKKDIQEIKKQIENLCVENSERVHHTTPEDAFVFNVDFYSLKNASD